MLALRHALPKPCAKEGSRVRVVRTYLLAKEAGCKSPRGFESHRLRRSEQAKSLACVEDSKSFSVMCQRRIGKLYCSRRERNSSRLCFPKLGMPIFTQSLRAEKQNFFKLETFFLGGGWSVNGML